MKCGKSPRQLQRGNNGFSKIGTVRTSFRNAYDEDPNGLSWAPPSLISDDDVVVDLSDAVIPRIQIAA
jgi:hypothetical protein